jgi:hypothetical protein
MPPVQTEAFRTGKAREERSVYGEMVDGVAEGVLAQIRREIRQRRIGLLRIDDIAEAVGMPADIVGPILRELDARGEIVVAPEEGRPSVVALPPDLPDRR